MGKLDSLRAAAKEKPAGNNNAETMAVIVEKYDLSGDVHYVLGRRFDTGEHVKVFLRDLENDDNRKGVKDYAAKRGMCATEVGGIIRFESAYQTEDGTYSARWMKQVSASPDSGVGVFIGQVRVSPTSSDSFGADLLYTESGSRVGSMDELKNAIHAALEPKGNNIPLAMLHIHSVSEGQSFSRIFSATRAKQGDNGFIRTATADVSMAEAIKKNAKVMEMLAGMISDPDVEVHVVPGEKIFAGNDFKKSIVEKNRGFFDFYAIKQDEASQDQAPQYGYVKSLVSIAFHPDGQPYLTGVVPIKYAKTAGVEPAGLDVRTLIVPRQSTKVAVDEGKPAAESQGDEAEPANDEEHMKKAAQSFRRN